VLPLFRRAQLARAGNPILTDRLAADLVSRVKYDFTAIERSYRPVRDIMWVARPLQIDRLVQRFLQAHPHGAVVNLGAGLDTSFPRVDNGSLRWFDLDLPEVIEIRRALIPETDRSRCIARSLFDPSWMGEVGDPKDGLCVISAGVLFYFPETELRPLFADLHRRLPGAEVVFDAVTPLGLKTANAMMGDAGVGARLQWALADPKELLRWNVGIENVERIPLFRGITRSGFSLKTRWFMFLTDLIKASSIIHCRV
jgi:O-methyltransferase involved in polyketide biosynthesis